jgi:hypothetical protein
MGGGGGQAQPVCCSRGGQGACVTQGTDVVGAWNRKDHAAHRTGGWVSVSRPSKVTQLLTAGRLTCERDHPRSVVYPRYMLPLVV